MKNYNLITEEEKNLVNDPQQFARIITTEYENFKNFPILERKSERLTQLKEFRSEYLKAENLRRIHLKAYAINKVREFKSSLVPKFYNQDLIGQKVIKMDGNFFAKYEDFFKVESIAEGVGTKKGFRLNAYVKSQYKHLDVCINASFWDHGVNISQDLTFSIFDLEDDKTTIKSIVFNDIDFTPINADQEIKNAKIYFDFIERSEKEARKLKDLCDHRMIEVIKTNL